MLVILGCTVASTHDHITIPNMTSSHSIFQAQSNPLVVLLDEFTSENYSSYRIASNNNGPSTSNISSKIWVAQVMHLISNSYSSGNTILPDSYDIHFYALPGSTFNVTFPSLSGSDGASVLVEFREFVESGLNGSVLESQFVKPSTDSQSVIYMLQVPGFVEVFIANVGASGTFEYNIMIKEILLEEAEYVCTINSYNTCQNASVYENNYLLAETTPESATVYPIITVTLVGKDKSGPTRVNLGFVIAGVIVALLGFVLGFVLLCCVVVCYRSRQRKSVTVNK